MVCFALFFQLFSFSVSRSLFFAHAIAGFGTHKNHVSCIEHSKIAVLANLCLAHRAVKHSRQAAIAGRSTCLLIF